MIKSPFILANNCEIHFFTMFQNNTFKWNEMYVLKQLTTYNLSMLNFFIP